MIPPGDLKKRLLAQCDVQKLSVEYKSAGSLGAGCKHAGSVESARSVEAGLSSGWYA